MSPENPHRPDPHNVPLPLHTAEISAGPDELRARANARKAAERAMDTPTLELPAVDPNSPIDTTEPLDELASAQAISAIGGKALSEVHIEKPEDEGDGYVDYDPRSPSSPADNQEKDHKLFGLTPERRDFLGTTDGQQIGRHMDHINELHSEILRAYLSSGNARQAQPNDRLRQPDVAETLHEKYGFAELPTLLQRHIDSASNIKGDTLRERHQKYLERYGVKLEFDRLENNEPDYTEQVLTGLEGFYKGLIQNGDMLRKHPKIRLLEPVTCTKAPDPNKVWHGVEITIKGMRITHDLLTPREKLIGVEQQPDVRINTLRPAGR